VGPGAVPLHELQKRELLADETSAAPACADHGFKGRPCPGAPYSMWEQLVVLDSWAKSEADSNPAAGRYAFQIQTQTVSQPTGTATLSRLVLKNVVEIEFGRFTFPWIDALAYVTNPTGASQALPRLVANGGAPPGPPAGEPNVFTALSQLPTTRVFVAVAEMNGQAANLPPSRYIAEFEVGRLSFGLGMAYSDVNRGGQRATVAQNTVATVFSLNRVLDELQAVTLLFSSPEFPIACPLDVLYGCQAVLVPDIFPVIPATVYDLQFAHPLASNLLLNDRVVVRGFALQLYVPPPPPPPPVPAPDPPVLYRINSYVQDVHGRLVGAGATTSPSTSFPLNPTVRLTQAELPNFVYTTNATTGVLTLVSTSQINVCVYKNRVLVTARVRGVDFGITNYKAV